MLDQARPAQDGVEVLFRGADRGPYHLSAILEGTDQQNLTFERALPLDLAADPAAKILIAYEMNGQPLGPDHGAPFRMIVPHWYAVASVKWLTRIDVLTEPFTGEFQTGHYVYEWPDKPHERVSLMRVRARITDPALGAIIPTGTYTVRGKAWLGTGSITNVDVSLTGEGDWYPAQVEPAKAPTSGKTGRTNGTQLRSGGRHYAPAPPTPQETSNQKSHPGTASATETTQPR